MGGLDRLSGYNWRWGPGPDTIIWTSDLHRTTHLELTTMTTSGSVRLRFCELSIRLFLDNLQELLLRH
jgi:hypothetical protein